MTADFTYRPKFVDVRVKRPDRRTKAEASPPKCDYVGCTEAGECRAPKSPKQEGQFWRFCLSHAAEYNRRWDYFQGMTEADLEAFRRAAEIGHRPTWKFRPSREAREAQSAHSFSQGRRDPFGFFQRGGEPAPAPAKPARSRLQVVALEILMLEEHADGEAIRARYAELVKRFHPDSNGGDRTAEAQLHRVIRAYQTLKAAGLA